MVKILDQVDELGRRCDHPCENPSEHAPLRIESRIKGCVGRWHGGSPEKERIPASCVPPGRLRPVARRQRRQRAAAVETRDLLARRICARAPPYQPITYARCFGDGDPCAGSIPWTWRRTLSLRRIHKTGAGHAVGSAPTDAPATSCVGAAPARQAYDRPASNRLAAAWKGRCPSQ